MGHAFWSGLTCLCLSLTATAATADTGSVTVRVVDNQTGQAIPARLVLRSATGDYPGDRLAASAQQWPHIEAHAVFIDGEHTFELPPGDTRITAAHGLEYKAQSQTLHVEQGREHTLELRLERVVDMRSAGWVSGDLHVHMIHGENQRQTSYEDVALTCAANGLDFVSVGQEYVGAGTLDLAGYHQKCRELSTSDFQMFLGAERPKNILGHLTILGCDNPFVISEEPPYFRAATAVHEQGGVLVYVHPVRYFPGQHYHGEWLDFPGNNLARELILDAYCGPSFDGLSVLSDEPANGAAHQLWFNLLNRGCCVPVFADSDACFDRPTLGLKAPGFWNTYFYIGPDAEVTQAALAEAVRRGRTMATTGPLVQFQIDGEISGATLPPDGKPREVIIQAHYPQHAFSLEEVDAQTKQPVGISRIELVRNGAVVHEWKPGSAEVRITHTIEEQHPAWYVVRAYGSDDRWQVALTSPIYFAEQPVPPKREPRKALVRGRIYDFLTGKPRAGQVEIRQDGKLLQQFDADGQFRVQMPLNGEITVSAEGERAISKNLLLDYGPIHKFLWYLESQDFGKDETLEKFELLTREVDLEFPLGYRMPGCFVAPALDRPTDLSKIRVEGGPEPTDGGSVAVAAVLTDAEQIAPGESMHVSVLFRDEGAAAKAGPYVIEARGYDPARPTGFGALKKFAEFEKSWEAAKDLGDGYKLVAGSIDVPAWVQPGPAGAIDLSVRARKGHGDAAFVGLTIPLGPTKRALTVTNSWPTMPLSWPDRSYGIGPLKVCNRIGRAAQPKRDYRTLRVHLFLPDKLLNILPARDGLGCADADDAIYTGHYFDQILNDESQLAPPPTIRPQPKITWREDLPIVGSR